MRKFDLGFQNDGSALFFGTVKKRWLRCWSDTVWGGKTHLKTNMEPQKMLVCRFFFFSKQDMFRFHVSFWSRWLNNRCFFVGKIRPYTPDSNEKALILMIFTRKEGDFNHVSFAGGDNKINDRKWILDNPTVNLPPWNWILYIYTLDHKTMKHDGYNP